jgi:hypothetical protein
LTNDGMERNPVGVTKHDKVRGSNTKAPNYRKAKAYLNITLRTFFPGTSRPP